MTKKTRVKICGLTRLEDAQKAVSLGAWAVGFIFFSKSPRFIEPARAAEIIRALPPSLLKFGVFVNESADGMKAAARVSGINAFQLHGNESTETARSLEKPWMKAFRLESVTDLVQVQAFAQVPNGLGALLDAAVPGEYGGTGKLSDWDLAKDAKKHGQVILSGGLNAKNVSQAIARVAPFAIDLSSGVESRPGIKDHKMLEELFHVVP